MMTPEQASILRRRAEVTAALVRKRNDGLVMFRPLADIYSDQTKFLMETCFEQISIGGNRSGKSVGAAVKFAAIARDMPIRTFDGKLIDCRRPHQKNRPLEMWVIGYDWEHIGHTIYKMLFEPRLFKVVEDRVTKQMRAWEPWNPDDAGRRTELRFAPPLIPESEVHEWGWVNKALKQFSRCELKNGTVIYAFASTGAVKAGDAVDTIWIDEKIEHPDYVPEWQARLVDNEGNFFWSSWPYASNQALRDIFDRANMQQNLLALGDIESLKKHTGGKATYTSRIFHSIFEKNPYLPPEEVAAQIARWGSKEAQARNLGQFVVDGTPIYPSFRREIHTAIYRRGDPRRDEISEILERTGGVPPDDWTCEIALDPGTAKPGVLFYAIPPRHLWGGWEEPPIIIWHEIYPSTEGRGMNATELANHIYQLAPTRIWNRFIIDGHAGRRTPEGFTLTIEQNYSNEFAKRGLLSQQHESRFIHGSDDFYARSMLVDQMMDIGAGDRPRLRIVTHRCNQLCLQLETNTKKMMKDVADERAATGQRDDLRVCLEYAISRNPQHVPPVNVRELAEQEEYDQWEKQLMGEVPETGAVLGARR